MAAFPARPNLFPTPFSAGNIYSSDIVQRSVSSRGLPNAEPKIVVAKQGGRAHQGPIPEPTIRFPESISNHPRQCAGIGVNRDRTMHAGHPSSQVGICTQINLKHLSSDRQLSIPPSEPSPFNRHSDVWPHDRHVPSERGDGAEEVSEEDGNAIELDDEADEGPAEEDEGQPGEEGGGAAGLLFAREEKKGLLGTDYYRQAD